MKRGGGVQKDLTLKSGARKVLLCLDGGTQNVSDPRFSYFVAPRPLPVINYQSLMCMVGGRRQKVGLGCRYNVCPPCKWL